MDRITIIVPCYNEEEVLPKLYEEIKKIRKIMPEQQLELLLVDDGSRDRTLELAKELAAEDPLVQYLSFSRNFGKEAAMYAGLENAGGDYVVFMDADLQDPPALLPEMYRAVTEEGYDSAATRRVTRKGEPPIRSFFARMFYKLMNRFSTTEVMDGARDYRLMNRKFVNGLLQLKEYNRFSKGLFGWVGFKTKWLEYENVERAAGETKWSFWKLFKYSIEGIVAFSTVPLVIASVVGLVCCLLSLLFIILIIIRKLMFNNSAYGWASLVCLITFLGGIQLFAVGVLGQYISKMYMEIKNRPIYLVGETNIRREPEESSPNIHSAYMGSKAADEGGREEKA